MCEVSLSTIIIISAPPFPGSGNCTCWSSKSSRHLLCVTPLTVTRHMPDTTFSFTQLHGIQVTKLFLLIPHAFWLLKRHQLHQAADSLHLSRSWWEGLLRAGDSQHSLPRLSTTYTTKLYLAILVKIIMTRNINLLTISKAIAFVLRV